MVAASPSLLGVVPPGSIASMVAAAVMVLAAISMVAEALPVVSLVAPPPLVAVEEEKEIEAPASPGEGLHGSPSRSKPKAPGGDMARTELECLAAARATEVVDIPSNDEADDMVEPPVSSRKLAMV